MEPSLAGSWQEAGRNGKNFPQALFFLPSPEWAGVWIKGLESSSDGFMDNKRRKCQKRTTMRHCPHPPKAWGGGEWVRQRVSSGQILASNQLLHPPFQKSFAITPHWKCQKQTLFCSQPIFVGPIQSGTCLSFFPLL